MIKYAGTILWQSLCNECTEVSNSLWLVSVDAHRSLYIYCVSHLCLCTCHKAMKTIATIPELRYNIYG